MTPFSPVQRMVAIIDLNFTLVLERIHLNLMVAYQAIGTRLDEVYPDTGIADADFPCEHSAGVVQLLLKPIQQMPYPFLVIGRSLKGLFPPAVKTPGNLPDSTPGY